MKISDKMFGNLRITWIRIILSGILCGAYTGIIMTIPALKNTSFQDIGIGFEWWILFAMLIIANSKSPKESACKTFAFFLISQPIVFLIQPNGMDLFHRYYGGWFIWTLFTFPMAWIGWYTRKNNIPAVLILSPMLILLIDHSLSYVRKQHILSAIFCLVEVMILIFAIFKEKKHRILAIIISIAAESILEFIWLFILNSDLS